MDSNSLQYMGVVFALGMVFCGIVILALYFVLHWVMDERGVGRRKFQ